MHDAEKLPLDVVAASGTGAALMGWIPEVTAVLTLIWVCIRIYESNTVQSLLPQLKVKRD